MNKPPPKLPATKPPTLSNDSPSSDNDNLWLITVLSGLGLLLLIMLALFLLLRQDMTGGSDSVAETTSNETMDQDSAGKSTADDSEETKNEEQDEASTEANEAEDDNQAPDSLTEDPETQTATSEASSDPELPNESINSSQTSEDEEEPDELPLLNRDRPSGVIEGGLGKGRGQLFGVEFRGNRVAYIVDYSSSMEYRFDSANSNMSRLKKAQKELVSSVDRLASSQVYTVLLFNDFILESPDFINVTPNKTTLSKLQKWLKENRAAGSTNPIPAMELVLADEYDVVFLVSDGEFGNGMVNEIKRLNKKNIVINTISLGIASQTLKKIALENQGKYITAR